jgi:hypothetical protein
LFILKMEIALTFLHSIPILLPVYVMHALAIRDFAQCTPPLPHLAVSIGI